MKFLVVFLSAIVLAAHGKVITDDEDKVYAVEIQPEEVGGYAAEETVQEAGGVGPQRVFALDASDPAVRVFGAEEKPQAQRAAQPFEDFAGFTAPDKVYIPILTKTCTDSLCQYICNLLGIKNGVCISDSTCQCSN